MNDKFIVLQDNKEKVGMWNLSFSSHYAGTEVVHLKTADYTIKGMEDIVCLERKRSTGEIALNLGKKWETFKAELERMQTFKYKYVICEFTINDVLFFPANSGVPKFLWPKLRMSGKFILARINELSETYGIEFIFAGNKTNAEVKAMEILTNVFLENKNR
jgi:hypothetical protein